MSQRSPVFRARCSSTLGASGSLDVDRIGFGALDLCAPAKHDADHSFVDLRAFLE